MELASLFTFILAPCYFSWLKDEGQYCFEKAGIEMHKIAGKFVYQLSERFLVIVVTLTAEVTVMTVNFSFAVLTNGRI